MIKKSNALSMVESTEYLDGEQKELRVFIKQFVELNLKDSKELRKKLNELNLIKLDEKSISKTIDFLPMSLEEINKVFNETSLNEDETKKVIELIKEFK